MLRRPKHSKIEVVAPEEKEEQDGKEEGFRFLRSFLTYPISI